MQPHCRRAVAFIAASLQGAESSPLLVDLTANEVFSFAGELSARRVVITNNRDGTYFTGADECGMLSLYDHDAERFFTFQQDRGRFWGSTTAVGRTTPGRCRIGWCASRTRSAPACSRMRWAAS